MTRNQLPDGVGKKIVEALKRQAEADITPVEDNEELIGNSLPLNGNNEEENFETESSDFENLIVEEEINNSVSINNQPETETDDDKETIEDNSHSEEESISNIISEDTSKTIPAIKQSVINELQKPEVNPQQSLTQTVLNHTQTITINNEKINQPVIDKAQNNINVPANISILRNLIATLPVGVTKQTGAQIIRQTFEAMGIPMNSVLKEAQDVQEELNTSTRECLLKIQEYKTNIMQLEKTVQEYQKSITQINDIVSLFLLTDK